MLTGSCAISPATSSTKTDRVAQSLQQRVANTLANDRTPTTGYEELLPLVVTERDRLAAAHVRASADSVDFALSEEARTEAAQDAQRFNREAIALGKAFIALQEKVDQRRQTDNYKAAQAARDAVLAERDQLTERWRAKRGEIDDLVVLLAATKANADAMRAAGVYERDAELEARDVRAAVGTVPRFLEMRIPEWNGIGRAWPRQHNPAAWIPDYAAEKRKGESQRVETAERARRAAEEHARTHGFYRLSTGRTDGVPVRIPTELAEKTGRPRLPRGVFSDEPWQGELSHATAEKLRQVADLNVRPIATPARPAPPRTTQLLTGSF